MHAASRDPSAARAGRLLTAYAVPGLPEIQAGDDLALLCARALTAAGVELRDGDVLALASKAVAKAEGRVVPVASRADHEGLVLDQSTQLVAERRFPGGTVQVVRSLAGPVLAGAGIDASNLPDGQRLLLPAAPDRAAEALRAALSERFGVRLAVVITDTAGRPWRRGQADYALGAAGLECLRDHRGEEDSHGNRLAATQRAIGDEAAAAADLVRGKSAGLPLAVIRGLEEHVREDAPGAADLVQPPETDWFRYGHLEAVRRALRVPGGTVAPPPADPDAEDFPERVERALHTAMASRLPSPGTAAWTGRVLAGGAVIRFSPSGLPGSPAGEGNPGGSDDQGGHPVMLATLGLSALVQRALTALAAEELEADVRYSWEPDGRPAACELHLTT